MQPSARSEAHLRAAVLALKAMSRDLRKEVSRQTREQGNPIWRDEIESHARTGMDRLVLAKGARIKAGNPAQAIAASSRRPLRDGLVPDDDAAGFEFGSSTRDRKTTYGVRSYSRRGAQVAAHKVSRRTKRQLPPRIRKGRVVYAAWAKSGPRLVSLWTQTIYRAVYDALGKE